LPKPVIPNQPGQKKEAVSPSPAKPNTTQKPVYPPNQPVSAPQNKIDDFSNFFGTKP
jgi:hypothetical protein